MKFYKSQKTGGDFSKPDNTYIQKPPIKEKIPFNFGTIFKDKDGDLLSTTQGRIYKDKYGKIHTEEEYNNYIKNGQDEISKFDGKPLTRGMSGADPIGQLVVENAILNKPTSYVFGRVFNAAKQGLIASNRAKHVYVNVAPAGYGGHGNEIKSAIKDVLKGKPADVSKPKWKIDGGDLADGYMPQYNPEEAIPIATKYRDEAWKKYLGISDGAPYYIKNKDGSYSYNLEEISKLGQGSGGIKFPNNILEEGVTVKPDYLTSAGGNLSQSVITNNKGQHMVTLRDRWDLHPFSRPGTISKRFGQQIKLVKGWEPVNKAVGNLIRDKVGKIIPPLSKIKDPKMKWVDKIDEFGRNFEVGKVLGGKPFDMKTTFYVESVPKIKVGPSGEYGMDVGYKLSEDIVDKSSFNPIENNIKQLELSNFLKLNDAQKNQILNLNKKSKFSK